MAGDWVKMRTDLAIDPRVIVIADVLGSSPEFRKWCCDNRGQICDIGVTQRVAIYVVVSALLKVWGLARSQGKVELDDIVVKPASLATIDVVSEVPGFGKALESVDWAKTESGPAVRFPNCVRHIFSPDEIKRLKDAERQRGHRRDKERDVSRECHKEVAPTIPIPIPNSTSKSKGPSPSSAPTNGNGDGVRVMQWGKTRSESDLLDDSKIDDLFGVVVANGFAHDSDEDRQRFFALVVNIRRQESSNRIGLLTRILEGKARSKFTKSKDWRARATDEDLKRARQALRALDGEGIE